MIWHISSLFSKHTIRNCLELSYKSTTFIIEETCLSRNHTQPISYRQLLLNKFVKKSRIDIVHLISEIDGTWLDSLRTNARHWKILTRMSASFFLVETVSFLVTLQNLGTNSGTQLGHDHSFVLLIVT